MTATIHYLPSARRCEDRTRVRTWRAMVVALVVFWGAVAWGFWG